ncbi:MAG: extracellular solute-binding protein [Oscillospiraceae bacterium]|nr:extracellular solute-binding protein [Oscillospiraceae bacterium]
MSLFRKALGLLLALAMLCALSACHGKRAEPEAEGSAPKETVLPEPAAAFDDSRPVEIKFWAKNDTNKTQIAIYQKARDEFQALYPNVTVKLIFYTDYGRIYNDVITNINTGTTPNVCVTYPDHIATYMTGEGVMLPLDRFMDDARYGLGGSELRFDGPTKDEIVPQFLSECVLDGHTYALPFMRSTEACYVNKTYVEKLGYELPEVLTWDFVWEVSEKALEKEADGETFKVNGQKTIIPFIYKSTDNMMIQMLRQRGADYSTSEGEVLLFNDTTKELLLEIAEHARSGAFDTFKHVSYPANFLNAGQCIFAVDSTAGATWMGSEAPLVDIAPDRLVRFETELRPVPQFDPEHPVMISQGPSVCIFNKADEQEVLASWLFVQYLLSNEVQLPYAETEGYVPVTSKAQNDPAYLDYLSRSGEDADHYAIKIRASELLLENTANTFTTPVFNGSASVRDAAGQLIESVNLYPRQHKDKEVTENTILQIYKDVAALHRLENSLESGPLPPGSVALLSALGAVWALIALASLRRLIKKKQAEKKRSS